MGLSAVVGSGMFNMFFVIGVCALSTCTVRQLELMKLITIRILESLNLTIN